MDMREIWLYLFEMVCHVALDRKTRWTVSGGTRNINSRLCKLDHLHLTFGRVMATLLGTDSQMDWDNWVTIGRQAEQSTSDHLVEFRGVQFQSSESGLR